MPLRDEACVFSLREEVFPALGFNNMVSHEIARWSYSRFPQRSQTQAGKLGTVINSSFSQVKYVTYCGRTMPAWHSLQGYESGNVVLVILLGVG